MLTNLEEEGSMLLAALHSYCPLSWVDREDNIRTPFVDGTTRAPLYQV